jgi:hypothetical protein
MATFEEKILAYLDGSLPAEGREELLAGMSGGGTEAARQRSLFAAHIRLADLMTAAQKTVHAPLAVQRELASKVPVLAAKLPYLASDAKRRPSAATGWFGWTRSSTTAAILFVALALVTGCVWFALNQKSISSSGGAKAQIASNNSTNLQSSGTASGSSANNSPQNASTPNPNSSLAAGDGSLAASSGVAKQVEVSHPHRTGSTKSKISPDAPAKIPSSALAKISSEVTALDYPGQSDNAGAPQARQTPEAPESTPNVPEARLLFSANPLPNAPAEIVGSGSTIHSLAALHEREENNDPLRVFAVEEYRFVRLSPQPALSDFSRSNGLQSSGLGFESAEFGLDYALDPWFSVGIRGGDARFVQEQAVTTPSNSTPGYPLDRNVRETILLDPFAVWFGPAISYSLSASQSASFTGTLTVADALVTALAGAFSPILRAEFAFIYDLTGAFALRLAASYEADWIPGATPLNLLPGSSASTSGIVVGSNAATHESQVFGLSFGIAFHP